jgi:hypothetical protein
MLNTRSFTLGACVFGLALAWSRPAAAGDLYFQRDLGAPPGEAAIYSAPAAATDYYPVGEEDGRYHPGPLLLAQEGFDNAVWTRGFDGHTWSGWTSLGGNIESRPAVASPYSGQWAVVGRGRDNTVMMRRFYRGWGAWEQIGDRDVTRLTPAVASSGNGSLDIAVTGLDQKLWWKRFDGTTWSAWKPLGGSPPLTSGPSLVAHADGRLDAFVRGNDNALWHRAYWLHAGDGRFSRFSYWAWGPWQSLGGGLPGEPAAARTGDGRMDVFHRGFDGALYQNTWDPLRSTDGTTMTGWSGYYRVAVAIAGDPAVASAETEDIGDSCRYHIFAKDPDSSLITQQYCIEDAPLVDVYRIARQTLFGPALLDSFLSRDPSEGTWIPLPDGVAWYPEGKAFRCFDGPAPGTVPLWRTYHPGRDVHQFFTSLAARNAELAAGAQDEGWVCFVYPPERSTSAYGPGGTCALWSVRRGNASYDTLNEYNAKGRVSSDGYSWYDGWVAPTWGRLGFAFSKNGACGIGDEGPPLSPTPPPPPPSAGDEIVDRYMHQVATEGFDAWELTQPMTSTKLVAKVQVVKTSFGTGAAYQVGFLPPGVSSEECMTSTAIVWIDEGGTLGKPQLHALTGAERPPWQNFRLAACARSLTGAVVPSSIPLKITLVNP